MDRQTKYLIAAVLLGPLAVFPAAIIGGAIMWHTGNMQQYDLLDHVLVGLAFATMGLVFAYPLTIFYGLPLFLILRRYKYERLWAIVIGAMIPVIIISNSTYTDRISDPLTFYGYFAIWVSVTCWLIAVLLPNKSSNKSLKSGTPQSGAP